MALDPFLDPSTGGLRLAEGRLGRDVTRAAFLSSPLKPTVWAGWSPGRFGVEPWALVNVTHHGELADTHPIPPGPGDVIEVVKRIREPVERLDK
jgi:hypothetical protein